LEEGQKTIEMRFDHVNRRIDDLRSEMNSRFEAAEHDELISIFLQFNGFFENLQFVHLTILLFNQN